MYSTLCFEDDSASIFRWFIVIMLTLLLYY